MFIMHVARKKNTAASREVEKTHTKSRQPPRSRMEHTNYMTHPKESGEDENENKRRERL